MSQDKPVLDLISINIPLEPKTKSCNGSQPLHNKATGRFEAIKQPFDLRGLILKSIIKQKCGSFEKFAVEIGKTRTWVWRLIHHPEIIKITDYTEKRMGEVLGINLKLKE